MKIAELILAYLKVLLSAPVMAGATAIAVAALFRAEFRALIGRIAHVKFGGGEILTMPQIQPVADLPEKKQSSTLGASEPDVGLPAGITLPSAEAERVEQMLRSARSTAYLWEYRYLNHFLVRRTQALLTWLAGRPPLLVAQLDAELQPIVDRAIERNAMVDALQTHHLVDIDRNGLITVTPKGREYLEWRGPLPSVPPEDKVAAS
jgi:hypothetical protein